MDWGVVVEYWQAIANVKFPLNMQPYLIWLYRIMIAVSLASAFLIFRWRNTRFFGSQSPNVRSFYREVATCAIFLCVVNAFMLYQAMQIIARPHHHAGPAFHVWIIMSRVAAMFGFCWLTAILYRRI